MSNDWWNVRKRAAAIGKRLVQAAGLLAALFVVEPELAHAQATISLNQDQIKRTNGSYLTRRVRRYWVNYAECVANDAFSFPLTVQSTQSLEVWVGNDDCAAKRGLDDHGQCWIVANYEPDDLSRTQNVLVPVRNIIGRDRDADIAPQDVGPEVCFNNTDEDGEQLTFYFFHEDGGKAVGGTSWNFGESSGGDGTGYDLVGPSPPGNIEVGFGESQLSIRIEDVGEDDDRERFEAFCVPAGTPAPASDAGAAAGTDAGTEATADTETDGGTAALGCATPLMRAGQRPPLGYSCGLAGETTRSMSTRPLSNDVSYAVGVAGQDLLGNAGALSQIACGTPIVLDDFFEKYSRYGGRGGGGFCTVSQPGRPTTSWLLPGLGLIALGGLRRRWKRSVNRRAS